MAVALVTGSNSGIGLATAVALARAGHAVAAAMRNLDRGEDIKKIAEKEKLAIHPILMDVNDDGSVAAGFATAVAELGPIDALINNAGVPGGGAVEETPIEHYRQVMETNFFGALRCIKAVVTSMRERRAGTIVNVTSIAGRVTGPAASSYCASKWALEALSETLAEEMRAFNVRVAIVEPGVIATPIFTKVPPPSSESLYPFRKRIRARFAALLANPVPPSVVADVIREIVDGGGRRLRYPVGTDAELALKARAATTDEERVEQGNESDEQYVARLKRDLGLSVAL